MGSDPASGSPPRHRQRQCRYESATLKNKWLTISTIAMNSRKLLFKHLNYPLFVPEQNRGILSTLAERGLSGMMAELERLSTLGSAWAASTLGYLSLLPSAEGIRDPKKAIELCSKAAAAGDSYALYVTSWAQYVLTQKRVTAAPAMIQSSRLQFAPALLAMSFFVWPDTKVALRFVDEAARRGHNAAWDLRCGYFKTGRLGRMRQILGYLLTPFARLRYVAGVWRDPFSENVLVVTLTDRRPAVRG
jgi:TPR repeat protein